MAFKAEYLRSSFSSYTNSPGLPIFHNINRNRVQPLVSFYPLVYPHSQFVAVVLTWVAGYDTESLAEVSLPSIKSPFTFCLNQNGKY